jgi:methyl-accepting chemotaxis protein
MTVRRKSLSIIALTCIGLMAVLYGIVRTFLLDEATGSEQAVLQNGMQGQPHFVGSILVAGIVFFAILWAMLERVVFSRLSHMDRSVANAAASDDVSARVNCTGKDELSSVAHSINRMLDSLQLLREQGRQMEERHSVFMNHLPAIASLTDEDGRYLYVNQPLSDTFNMRSEDLLGKTIAD